MQSAQFEKRISFTVVTFYSFSYQIHYMISYSSRHHRQFKKCEHSLHMNIGNIISTLLYHYISYIIH